MTDGMGRLFWGIGDGKGAYLVAKGWSTVVVSLDYLFDGSVGA